MDLHEKIRSLPDAPGVYLFTDAEGALLYVGKAVSLRKRVQSYFSERDFGYDAERLGAMVAQIAEVEYLLTANELEALILESNLIKERRPRYNIVLRDDKHYPFIRLDLRDPFPALQVVRRIRRDGALYFGPYVPAGTMWNLLALIHRTFPLRTCRSIAGRTRCLEYHLGRCLAPCEALVTAQEYGQMVQEVRLLLEGRDREVIGQLESQMRAAAERLEFERAARLRDQIASLRRAGEGQRVLSARGENQDVFGVAHEGREAQVQLLVVRGGKLIGRDRFPFEDVPSQAAGALLGALLPQYYLGAREIPRDDPDVARAAGGGPAGGHALGAGGTAGDAQGAGARPQGAARGDGGRHRGGRPGAEPRLGVGARARHGGGAGRTRPAAPAPPDRVCGYLQHLRDAGRRLSDRVRGRPLAAVGIQTVPDPDGGRGGRLRHAARGAAPAAGPHGMAAAGSAPDRRGPRAAHGGDAGRAGGRAPRPSAGQSGQRGGAGLSSGSVPADPAPGRLARQAPVPAGPRRDATGSLWPTTGRCAGRRGSTPPWTRSPGSARSASDNSCSGSGASRGSATRRWRSWSRSVGSRHAWPRRRTGC